MAECFRVSPIGGGSSDIKTILVVEDEATVRSLVREFLQLAGYRVREASDGVEALRHIADGRARIDLLLTDLVMPRMGGKELAERVEVIRPEIRILYMSGYTDELVDLAGERNAGRGFLQKPFRRDTLLGKVHELLAESRRVPDPGVDTVDREIEFEGHPETVTGPCI